jgi:hypothetical protein
MGRAQEGYKVKVRQRWREMDPIVPAEHGMNRTMDVGVRMHRKNKFHIRETENELFQRPEDIPERFPEALAAMHCHEKNPRLRTDRRRQRTVLYLRSHVLKGVDHRVSRDEDPRRRYAGAA